MNDERPFMHRIAKRLGLAEGASEDEAMKALWVLRPTLKRSHRGHAKPHG